MQLVQITKIAIALGGGMRSLITGYQLPSKLMNDQTKALDTTVLYPLMEEYLLVLIAAIADTTCPSDYNRTDKKKFDLPEQVWIEIENMSYADRLAAIQSAASWLAWSSETRETITISPPEATVPASAP
ncbi:hypothetical protein [Cylindrospermum sp. FACHB-282]|uniref:hypothetical protein n=1 Tax=Cylindrospermum sp. FACHB-282 TaxID=2692794 RepID=UPI0019CC5A65|nr:hypothetical protein [Cylindrospermum sp. FACHB-282]MBD2386923.1 hypothetical protein [Cylindrospermum sp. FACHB-282]